MPNCLDETRDILRFIASEISPHTYVNIMDQYRPCGEAYTDSLIGRRITQKEFLTALSYAKEIGLTRLDERRSYFVWSL